MHVSLNSAYRRKHTGFCLSETGLFNMEICRWSTFLQMTKFHSLQWNKTPLRAYHAFFTHLLKDILAGSISCLMWMEEPHCQCLYVTDSFGQTFMSGVAGLHGSFRGFVCLVYISFRNLHDSCSSCTSSHSHQQCVRAVPFLTNPC